MEVLKRLPFLLLLAAGLAGCELLREPTPLEFTDEQVLVASVLESGATTVSVLLVGLRPVAAPGRVTPLDVVRPISGATVLLFRGADTVRLRENAADVQRCYAASLFRDDRPGGLGCYGAFLPDRVQADARYGLLIRLPGGGEIRGEATVPDTLALQHPLPRARYAVPASASMPAQALTVQWAGGAQGAAQVMIGFAEMTVFEEARRVPNSHCFMPRVVVGDPLRADSISIALGQVQCQEVTRTAGQPILGREIRWDSIHAQLNVTAYDSAFARYHAVQGGEAIVLRDAAVGVSGAIGIFASGAVTRRPIVLTATR